MNWNAISAIGTCLAAFVGIAGIWLNLWDKTKKLNVHFEVVPSFKIYISNNSLRTAMITKIVYSVNTHVVYVEFFDGLHELPIPPATSQSINVPNKDIYSAYIKMKMNALCSPNDKVTISIYDNYARKYIIKTDCGIDAFQQ